jgi:hypothetical protein
MAYKSVVAEAQQVHIAVELIELGARLQLIQAETTLSRERLLKLYKEIKGESPSKGMLPYSDRLVPQLATQHPLLVVCGHSPVLAKKRRHQWRGGIDHSLSFVLGPD